MYGFVTVTVGVTGSDTSPVCIVRIGVNSVNVTNMGIDIMRDSAGVSVYRIITSQIQGLRARN